jgi:type II secretory pathway pseudopilin PulG
MARVHSNKGAAAAAFTLRELVVVMAVLSLLGGMLIDSMHRAASWRIKKVQCAANLRQFAVATFLYANENRDRLPEITVGAWAWDLPTSVADSLLQYGMEQRTFYCPGTAPRFDDKVNFQNPYPNSLWTFAESGGFRVIGYVAAYTGPAANPTAFNLVLSNQNTTILLEPPKINSFTFAPVPPNSERVLLADATISENAAGTPAVPAAAGSFTIVVGGFSVNGTLLPHLSPHLKGSLPAGGNLAFKDGHVAWRRFAEMQQRAVSQRGFWW